MPALPLSSNVTLSRRAPDSETVDHPVDAGEDGPVVIEVGGELDSFTGPPLQDRLFALTGDRGLSTIVLDMADVRFMDSSGLHALVEVHKLLQSRGGELVLRNTRRNVVKVLRITGMDRVLTLAD